MSWKAQVLLVDDDATIRRIVMHALTAAGYRVLESADGFDALAVTAEQQPEVIILDVAMPGIDGFQTLTKLRQRGFRQPVLMLSSLNDVDHRLKGLGAGADDYIGKPFDMRELSARVEALLRRRPPVARRLHFGDTVVDLEKRSATRGRAEIALTSTEYKLLDALARNLGKPVSREHLLDVVWGYSKPPLTRTIETHVWRLRKKLGDAGAAARWLRNFPGVGYSLSPDVTDPPGESHQPRLSRTPLRTSRSAEERVLQHETAPSCLQISFGG